MIPLIGIDPAFRTGGFRMVIVDEDGEAQAYKFKRFVDFTDWAYSDNRPPLAIVCVENSNMDKSMFAYHRSKQGGRLATASRNVGSNQAISQATFEICERFWPDSTYQITPKQKGAGWDKATLAAVMKQEGHDLIGKFDKDAVAAYQCLLIGARLHRQKRKSITSKIKPK